MDAMITTLIAMHDLRKTTGARNSVAGSVYVVKPKMHGPEEVAFADDTVRPMVEEVLGLPRYTVKLGIMDEERRTSVNLKECIRAAKHRVAFINTGFLDRTGDEIHTSMEAGRSAARISSSASLDHGLREPERRYRAGMRAAGRADRQGHVGRARRDGGDAGAEDRASRAGANCAWVPSPTAATLHALHYHRVDVAAVQEKLEGGRRALCRRAARHPAGELPALDAGSDPREVENNAQGILGYVVRWIDQGVGCSKVPDINDVG
jgi:malate synthase